MASGKSRMKDKAQYLLGALTIKDAHFKTMYERDIALKGVTP
jgi:hypothetical protein